MARTFSTTEITSKLKVENQKANGAFQVEGPPKAPPTLHFCQGPLTKGPASYISASELSGPKQVPGTLAPGGERSERSISQPPAPLSPDLPGVTRLTSHCKLQDQDGNVK